MKKKGLLFIAVPLLAVAVFVRMFCGIFVVQPIGALPEGATVFYWRSGLNLPFIASADGILSASDKGVSLLGRGLFIGAVAKVLEGRKLASFGYSDACYLWSTGGKRFET